MALISSIVLGFLFGLIVAMVFIISENKRSKSRKELAFSTAVFSALTLDDINKLFHKKSTPQWITFMENEKVTWLNRELRKVWPYIDQAASDAAKIVVEPILEQYKPTMVTSMKFQKFTLGTVAPQFVGVRIVDTNDDKEIVMELELQWDGNPSIVLGVRTMLGVSIPIKVENIAITGIFRLVFKPLVDDIPCFGAIMYSLRQQKNLDFRLKVLRGDTASFPGLAGAIDGMIRTAITDTLLWPMRQVIPILPGDYSDLQVRTIGKLEVKLVQAKGLLNMDLIGKSDPFVMLYVRPIRDRMKKSRTINNQLNPVWNEQYVFDVEDLRTQYLVIQVFDDEGLQMPEFIGCARIRLRALEPGTLTEFWVPLVKDMENAIELKDRGQVHLELLYRPTEAQDSVKLYALTSLERVVSSKMNSTLIFSRSLQPISYYTLSPRCVDELTRGVLSVKVLRAENLSATDFGGKSDPYVVLQMKKKSQKKRTKVLYKTLNPEWNQSFLFLVEDATRDMLVAEVWDHDIFGKNYMGGCALTLSKVLHERNCMLEQQLSGVRSGKLVLQLEWTPDVLRR